MTKTGERKCSRCGTLVVGKYLCDPCNREKVREYRRHNPDKVREYNRRRDRSRYRDYHREYSKKWREMNVEKRKATTTADYAKRRDVILDWKLKNRYGITKAERDEMYRRQGGKCAICRVAKARTLHVDHCHRTGEVRGLLCSHCNWLLGCLGDSLPELRKTVAKFEKYLRGR